VVRVAVGGQRAALRALLVGVVEAEHPAQEAQRRDDVAVAARRRLGDEDPVAVLAGLAQPADAGEVEVAVDGR
jgi:hypothetical protein